MSRRNYLLNEETPEVDFDPQSRRLLRGEIWGAALVSAGAAAYGANEQRGAARDAARGMDAAAQVEMEMYQQQRRDQMPWLQAGQRNLATLEDLNQGDFSSFTESPDYAFARDQGIKGLDRSAASRGTQYSGGQLAALADFSGGLASQNYGAYYNRIAGLAGVGQTAANQLGAAGQNYANAAGNLAVGRGNVAADARLATASTYGRLGEQLGGAFGRWYQNRAPSSNGGTGAGMGGFQPTSFNPWAVQDPAMRA